MKLHKLLLVPDTHVPFQDKRAFALVVKTAKAVGVDTVICIGDFADMLSCSMHDPMDDKRTTLKDEVYEVNKALDKLDGIGAKRKIYLSGNHEHRLERFLARNAPTLFDSLKIPELFKLKARGWEYVPYMSHIKVGAISYTHDTGSSGATAHMKSGAVFESSVVQGHTHRLATSYFGNANGETHVAVSLGWLGSAEAAQYMHKIRITKDWQTGFGIGYMEPNGVTHIQAVPIIDYRCVVEGKVYQG